MGYRIREITEGSKLSSAVTLEAISQGVPRAAIEAVLQEEGAVEQRERKMTMVMVVFALIAMHRHTDISLGDVLRKISRGLRFIWPDPEVAAPTAGALSDRRYQLGARPLATAQTKGAFLYSLRLMATRRDHGERARHAGQRRRVRAPPQRAGGECLPPSQGRLPGRVWHPCHRRCGVLAVPH